MAYAPTGGSSYGEDDDPMNTQKYLNGGTQSSSINAPPAAGPTGDPSQTQRRMAAPQGAPSGDPSTNAPGSGSAYGASFADLQKAGRARPAPPQGYGDPYSTQQQPGMLPQGQLPAPPPQTGGYYPAQSTPAMPQPGLQVPGAPQMGAGIPQLPSGPTPTPTPFPQAAAPGSPAAPAATDQTGQIGQTLQQSILAGLQNPSPYLNDAFMGQFNKGAGQIDDQYNTEAQQLKDNLARRGLGGTYDSTIGAGTQQYQNLQRRSAKSDLATSLMNGLATTYSGNLTNAQNAAMNYGNDSFNHQTTTQQINNQQQQQYQDLMLKLLGLS